MWDKIKAFFRPAPEKKNSNKLILVVDDGEVERKFMHSTLTSRGYAVLTASSGEEGIKIANEKKPDLIYLDYSMPGGLDGKTTCKKIKQSPGFKETPIVFLSGSVSPGKVIECYDAGAEYYLSKPISAATLLEHTRLLLEDADVSKDQPIAKSKQ